MIAGRYVVDKMKISMGNFEPLVQNYPLYSLLMMVEEFFYFFP